MTITYPPSVIQYRIGAINFLSQASLTAGPMLFGLPSARLQMAVTDRSQTSMSQQGCGVEHYAPVPHCATVGTVGTWL